MAQSRVLSTFIAISPRADVESYLFDLISERLTLIQGWGVPCFDLLYRTSLGQFLRVSTHGDLLNFHPLAPVQNRLYRGCDGLNSFEQHRWRHFVGCQVEVRWRLNPEVRANRVSCRFGLQLPLLLVDLLPVPAG